MQAGLHLCFLLASKFCHEVIKKKLSGEHEILIANKFKAKILKKRFFFLLQKVLILLINVKMPTIVGILTFMSRKNFMLSRAEHETHNESLMIFNSNVHWNNRQVLIRQVLQGLHYVPR